MYFFLSNFISLKGELLYPQTASLRECMVAMVAFVCLFPVCHHNNDDDDGKNDDGNDDDDDDEKARTRNLVDVHGR